MKRKHHHPYPEFPRDGLAVVEHGRDATTLRPTYWARYSVDGFGVTQTDHCPYVAAHRALVDGVRWATSGGVPKMEDACQ